MAAKQPTNSVLLRELKDIKDMQLSQAKDIDMLKNWKIAEDAAKAAVAKYKQDEQVKLDRDGKRKLIRDVGAFLSVLTILIWSIVEYLGSHHH